MRYPTSMLTFRAERFSRRALTKPNLTYFLWRFVANGLRTFRAMTTAYSFRDTRATARELTTEGIVVGPSDRFLTEGGRAALTAAADAIIARRESDDVQALVRGQASTPDDQKEFVAHLVSHPDGVIADGPLLKVALDEKLLETISGYLGFWPGLYSIDAWLNFPTDAPPAYSQLWHRDPEDLRQIKVFIYLSEVHAHSGPFTYIPRTQPFGADAGKARRYEHKKRLSDKEMQKVFPQSAWRVCTGEPFTMVLADTLGYHRGGKPTEGTRTLITFTYTSGTPILDRPLRLAAKPEWIAGALQEYAAAPLLEARPQVEDQPKKRKKKKKG